MGQPEISKGTMRFLTSCVGLALLVGGCAQTPLTAPRVVPEARTVAMASGLATRVKRLFHDVYDLYDADEDEKWMPKDFGLPEDRYLNLFHNYDVDDDHMVTRDEFYSKERHEDMVVSIQSRAQVSAAGVNGRVSFDKALFFLDVYLKPYLNGDQRKRFIKKAFTLADEDDSGYLKAQELEIAFAILEAKAVEKGIEKGVNRSKGQPNEPIDIDGPNWVKGKK